MRVLFVAPYLPTPGSGGRTRLANFMARHAKRHEVSLVALLPPDQDPAGLPYPCTTVPYPYPHRSQGWRGTYEFYIERVVTPLPVFAYQARSPEFSAAIARQVLEFSPDLVQFTAPETGQYIGVVPDRIVKSFDFVDSATRWLAREAAKPFGLQRRVLLSLDVAKSRRYERGIARSADVRLVTTELEQAELRRIAGLDAIVAPNGVDAQVFAPMPSVTEEANRLLFVGPMKYQANIDAVKWFSADILPLVQARVPGASLEVIGLPSDENFGPGVRQLGKVDDVRREYARAPVGIVPIRVGAGSRYKILEALAMERAVVSTTLGAEALGVRDREHLLIADTAASFADAVVELLGDPALRARLGAAGRAHVAARYDWEPIVTSVEEAWAGALASHRAG
jgi:glycosyltransferase involved in cell wall biosynthesis